MATVLFDDTADDWAARRQGEVYGNARIRATYAELAAETGWSNNENGMVTAADTGTHASVTGDIGESGGQTPNSGYYVYSTSLTALVRVGALESVASQASATAADTSANFAEEFSGPAYANQAAGEAATTTGQFFRVWNGDTPRTYTRYERTAGGSEVAVPLATSATVNALIQAAYIDFTTKADGTPPSVLDTGQPVYFHQNATGREPQILSGRLVVKNPPASGGLADYYQANIAAPLVRIGAEWTQPTGADDGNGNITIAAWDSEYQANLGLNVPRSWCHLSIVPTTDGTGRAIWFVCNGTGNLFSIKEQAFTNPAADGKTRWQCEAYLDVNGGKGYAWLPDGSVMTVTDANIATACTALGIATLTFADLESKFLMCEHFATTGANTAKFGGFTAMWGEANSTLATSYKSQAPTAFDVTRRSAALSDRISAPPVAQSYAPTTAMSVATTNAAANVDATNAKVDFTAGATGRAVVDVSAYYEWSATDVVYWKLVGTGISTPTRAADVGLSGQKRVARQMIVITGLVPGQPYSAALQHWSVTAGSATAKAGGSGAGMLPPLTITALPA